MSDEEEQKRKSRLDQARQAAKIAKNAAGAAAGSPTAALALAKDAMSFGKKLSKHWMILFAAAIFDIFGLIPILGDLSDFAFGILLWFYFHSKKTQAGTDFKGILLPEFVGSVVRLPFSFLPVNVGTTLYRISLSEE